MEYAHGMLLPFGVEAFFPLIAFHVTARNTLPIVIHIESKRTYATFPPANTNK